MSTRLSVMVAAVLLAATSASAQNVNPADLSWQTCSACPQTPSVSASGATVRVGNSGSSESDSQASAFHAASALLPPADAYKVTFEYDLSTWDSYNAPGTPNPPFNGGTGFWDSFSVSVSRLPIWNVGITDPYTTSKLPGLGFLWGGSSFGDSDLQTTKGKKSVTVLGNADTSNYINLALDTASAPYADNAYPSWGTFKIIEIVPTCAYTVALQVPLYKQYDARWGSDKLDHVSDTMKAAGCAVTSAAMVLSYYGAVTTPGELNKWLTNYYDDANANGTLDAGEATYGYRRNGAIKWEAVATFSGNLVTYKHKESAGGKAKLDAELCAGRPTILQVPGHFIVATGKTDGASPDYPINDPGYNKDSLADYNNSFSSMRVFGPPGSGSIVFYYPTSIRLLVVDPLGRKVGTENGIEVNEILGASDGLEQIDRLEEASTALSHRVLHIPDPAQGFYRVTVSSGEIASGVVEINRYTRDERPQTQISQQFAVSDGVTQSFDVPYSTKKGDVSGDGFVNEQDAAVISRSLYTKLGGPGFNPVADVDGDGVVGIKDYLWVVEEIPGADLDNDGVLDSSDSCVGSITASPITIGACDTGVTNTVFADGCTMSDHINKCALNIRNHGGFVSCVAKLTNSWLKQKTLSDEGKDKIQSCAGEAKMIK